MDKIAFVPGTQDADFSCLLLPLPTDISQKIKEWANSNIPDNILYTEEGKGREEYIHCTIKFGINDENPDEVLKLLKEEKPIKIQLGQISLFESSKKPFDVVKIEVNSPDLHRINKEVTEKIKCTDTFPNYVPHITLAYIKKGYGDRFKGLKDFDKTSIEIPVIEFSSSKKEKGATSIPLQAAFLPSLTNAPDSHSDTDSDVLIPIKPEWADCEEGWHFPYKDRGINWNEVLPAVLTPDKKEGSGSAFKSVPLAEPPRDWKYLTDWFKKYTFYSPRWIASIRSEKQAYAIASRLYQEWKTKQEKREIKPVQLELPLTYGEVQSGLQPATTWDSNEPYSPLPTNWEIHRDDGLLDQQYEKQYYGLRDNKYWDNLALIFQFLEGDGFEKEHKKGPSMFQVDSYADNHLILKKVKGSAYSDQEMEEIYTKTREDSGGHYGEDTGGGFTPHEWNQSTNDFPKPKDMEKGQPLDQLVPVERRFDRWITPPTARPPDFLSMPSSNADEVMDYEYTKDSRLISFRELRAIDPVTESTQKDPIDFKGVKITELGKKFVSIKGEAYLLGKNIPWSAQNMSVSETPILYKLDTSEIEKAINSTNLGLKIKRAQIERVKNAISHSLYSSAGTSMAYKALPNFDQLDQIFSSFPTTNWSANAQVEVSLENMKDKLRQFGFDSSYFTVFPKGQTRKFSWYTFSGQSILVTNLQ